MLFILLSSIIVYWWELYLLSILKIVHASSDLFPDLLYNSMSLNSIILSVIAFISSYIIRRYLYLTDLSDLAY